MGKLLGLIFLFFFGFNNIPLLSQEIIEQSAKSPTTIPPPVVISKYCNKPQPQRANEWIEFLVVEDNANIHGWRFGDDNCNQAGPQPRTTFNNIPFWNNLRKGTVIVVWIGSPHTAQVVKKDGYIEVCGNDPAYFTGASVVDICLAADLMYLMDATGATGNLVHKFGHGMLPPTFTAGPSFTNPPTEPKLNYSGSLNDTYVCMVSPGDTLTHYGYLSAGTQDGNLWAAVRNNGDAIKGLPNPQNPNNLAYPATANSDFWRKLRQPTWTSQPLTFTYDPNNTKVTLGWTAATDPYPADRTQGYMIVRNTVNTFGDPVDGHTYNLGEPVTGGGTVIDTVNSSQTLTRIDNTAVPCTGGFYYRVYAFRYIKDAVLAVEDKARGRAYNETYFASGHAQYPLPVAPTSATATPNNYCAGTPPVNILLETTWPGSFGATLYWYSGGCGTGAGGTLLGAGSGVNNSFTINTPPATPGTYTYYARGENACGNSTCASVTVTVNPSITPTFTQIGPLCQNSNPPPLPTTSNNGITGTWNPPVINTSAGGTFTYIFTPDNPAQCGIPTSMNITITLLITPLFTPIGPLCLNSTPPSLPTTSNNGITGTWSPPTINTSTTGTSTYTFTPDNPTQCGSTTTMDITVSSQIIPLFDPIGPLCLNSTPPPLPTTSNDGITGTWSPPTINTSSTGTSTYTFTPDNPAQCGTTTTMDITISSQITPLFDPIGPLCLNSTPTPLPATSNNGITGIWSPPTINTSTTGTSTYTFTPDNPAQCGVPASINITITSLIIPLFSPIGQLCLNSTPPPLPTTSNNGITGIWSPLTINTLNTGTSTYTFTPDNAAQCGSMTTMDITISSQITPLFDPIGPLCLNSTPPLLPTTSNNGITGTWSPPTINSSTTGTFTYTFTPDNPAQCGATTNMYITISLQITPLFNPIGPLCQNSSPPTLPATSINGITGTWSPPAINTSLLGISIYTFTPVGGAGQCAIPTTIPIEILFTFTITVSVTVDPLSVCSGTEVTFTADTLNAGSSPDLEWFVNGASVQSGPSVTFKTSSLSGGEPVTCRLTSSLGCVVSNPVTSTPVSVSVSPTPHITLTSDPFICAGTATQLDAGPDYTSYLWQDGSTAQYYSASDVGLYWVRVTDTEGCTGGSDTVIVKVCETGIYVPTAFSPNGDGINDIFKVVATLDLNTSFTLSVVSRWGETVFESNKFTVGWDGTTNGQLLPPGIYAWKIVYQSVNSTEKPTTLKGTVTLLR